MFQKSVGNQFVVAPARTCFSLLLSCLPAMGHDNAPSLLTVYCIIAHKCVLQCILAMEGFDSFSVAKAWGCCSPSILYIVPFTISVHGCIFCSHHLSLNQLTHTWTPQFIDCKTFTKEEEKGGLQKANLAGGLVQPALFVGETNPA